MYQQIQGIWMEIFDFDTMPELPITGLTDHEREKFHNLYLRNGGPEYIRVTNYMIQSTFTYAEALTKAIKDGIITEPGKYGIQIIKNTEYVVHKIIEE